MYHSVSLLGNIWKIKNYNEREYLMLSQKHNIPPLIAKLLNVRNIEDSEVEDYLNPELLKHLPNPFHFKDMEKSVKRVFEALFNKQTIGIIADYDVDGSTSVALLTKFFKQINQKVIIKIPNRLHDGYGPNHQIMNQLLNDKIDLLFTLDCGTNSFGIIDHEKYKYIDTIIIDHHISETKLPKVFSIINPNRFDDNNQLKDLSAVGVTFLFTLALRKYLREKNFFKSKKINEPNLLTYLDLVALGTICDVVNLKKYNRFFVSKGIKIIQKRTNKGIAKIIDNSKISSLLSVSDLGYIIGPQLNAASRIDDSTLSSKILISENIIEIESISRKLLILNEKRKLIEKQIYEEALQQAYKQINNNIIIVKGDAWHNGVLGIVASKIVEKFYKPAIVISFDSQYGTGSARSVPNIDLGQIILKAKKEGFLVKGGGHKMAAGLKVSKNLFNKFEKYIIDCFMNFDSSYFQKIQYYDSYITLDEINIDFLHNIEKLEPFGSGNPEPQFIIKNIKLDFLKIIKDKHIFLNFKNNYEKIINGISFNCVNNSLGENLIKNKFKRFDIACTIRKDNYKGNNQPQLIVHDAKLIN